jgi:rhamnogalacturonyl hydrolase YesR
MERVGDWQLANPSKHDPKDWTVAAGYTGLMALAGISGKDTYQEALRASSAAQGWKLGPRLYDADDHCVGQTYAELYLAYRDRAMIEPLRERFDAVLAKPSSITSYDFTQKPGDAREIWSWCDSLFMGPPTWMRLYAATGDARSMDFAVSQWWKTTDFLYDRQEHLYSRDSTFLNRHEANGRKVFWSRGNGWVIAGLVRMLQYLPENHPDRARFERLFTDMAAKVVECQQPDGLWRASLLDPASYPLKEASGSGFYVYALAWGVNQGLLDRERYGAAALLGWKGLVSCVAPDGRLTHVQPVGYDPRHFPDDATEVYGVGSFLLAGSEIYRLQVLEAAGSHHLTLGITNPSPFRRTSQTIELHLAGPGQGSAVIPAWSGIKAPVAIDGNGSRIIDSQAYGGPQDTEGSTFVFQVDLAPGETRRVTLVDRSFLPAVPAPLVKTFVRQVPERFNDVAWESDLAAHRVYHLDLIKGEGTTSSGIDVWSKSIRGLVVDEFYRRGDYHNDHGHGLDDYRVGKSRGCGGLGIWDGTALHVSSNFSGYRLVTTGPVRSRFELTYDAWDAGGRKVSEKRILTIDAGSPFTRADSVLSSDGAQPLTAGIGIGLRHGAGNTLTLDPSRRWFSYWQAEDRDRGHIGCAVVLTSPCDAFVRESGTLPKLTEAQLMAIGDEGLPPEANELALVQTGEGGALTYYFGSAWSKGGEFRDSAGWEAAVSSFAEAATSPVTLAWIGK